MARERCGLSNCRNLMGPGAAEVGFVNSKTEIQKVRVCHVHAEQLMFAPRGSYCITDDLTIKAIPAKRIII